MRLGRLRAIEKGDTHTVRLPEFFRERRQGTSVPTQDVNDGAAAVEEQFHIERQQWQAVVRHGPVNGVEQFLAAAVHLQRERFVCGRGESQ